MGPLLAGACPPALPCSPVTAVALYHIRPCECLVSGLGSSWLNCASLASHECGLMHFLISGGCTKEGGSPAQVLN